MPELSDQELLNAQVIAHSFVLHALATMVSDEVIANRGPEAAMRIFDRAEVRLIEVLTDVFIGGPRVIESARLIESELGEFFAPMRSAAIKVKEQTERRRK